MDSLSSAIDTQNFSFNNSRLIYGRGAPISIAKPISSFGSVGTGGFSDLASAQLQKGYKTFVIIVVDKNLHVQELPTAYQKLIEEIQKGFGRTFSSLPAIFGVSRQTLYNWRNGESPKQPHQSKLIQLAKASHIFSDAGFKPDPLSLDRVITQGKSFIELMSEGANGVETAQKLIRIIHRRNDSMRKLDDAIGDTPIPNLSIADMGQRSFSNEA
jgi:transcriptional regulator with XRE-family HTH domain